MLGFMSFSCNNNQEITLLKPLPQYGSRTYNSETLRNILQQPEQQRQLKTIEIKSETNGAYYLQKNPKTGRPYQLGDIVEAGAVIIRLENKEYENNVQLESKKLQIQITEKEWEGQKILLEKGGATEKT